MIKKLTHILNFVDLLDNKLCCNTLVRVGKGTIMGMDKFATKMNAIVIIKFGLEA